MKATQKFTRSNHAAQADVSPLTNLYLFLDDLYANRQKANCDAARASQETLLKLREAVYRKVAPPIEQTQLSTWFERDRQCVALFDARNDNTLIEWWDSAVSEAVEDGFLNPRDYHSSAYEHAVQLGLLPVAGVH